MKAITSLLAAGICAGALTFPQATYAFSWDWVPRVLRLENPYRGFDTTYYPRFECKLKNTWGNCVVFGSITEDRPSTQRNYYRRISSFGDGLEEASNYESK